MLPFAREYRAMSAKPHLASLTPEACLPARVLRDLDDVAVSCFDIADRFTRANCILAVAQFYLAVGELRRAGRLLDQATGNGRDAVFPCKVPSSISAGKIPTHPSSW